MGPVSLSTPAPERRRLATLLAHSRAALLERWTQQVLDDPRVPGADRLSLPTLHDHIPTLIDRLVARLSAEAAEDQGDRNAPASGAIALGVAHAQQRAAVHYSVGEGVRELAHFRAAVLAFCDEKGMVLDAREAAVFHSTLDEMMTASAVELDRASLRAQHHAVAVVAHELRNPLSALVIASEGLRAGFLAPNANTFELLARNTVLMERLVADLLTVSTLEAGHFRIRLADVDVRAIVHDTCDQLRAVAASQGIDLDAHVPDDPVVVHCDRDRVMQALGNLVANALKFTPEEGRVEIQLEPDLEHCTFRVTDTGPGIAAPDAAKVFQPFWQAPSATGQGTGLGLAIARGIVEAHGGTIELERTGPGAVFAFRLPRLHRPSFVPTSIRP